MLLFCRYLVFGLLVICNAILCSVAVWNLSLAQSFGRNSQVDAFLTFNVVTGRLWFEVLWVGLFWIMELSGATAVSAMTPDFFCTQSPLMGNDACVSTHVLLAFSWSSTVILLVYLVCLVCAAIIRQKRDPQIWHASVVEICWCDTRHDLRSAPTSPSLPRFYKTLDVIAPQPRPPPPLAIYAYRAGMGPEYHIEHFRPDPKRSVPAIAHSPSPTSLYPQHINSSLTPQQLTRPCPSPPPPLGHWPRLNAVDQPLRSKRKSPPTTFKFSDVDPVSQPVLSPLSASRPKPTGLRRSLNENRRPPPLNLTHSAFRSGSVTVVSLASVIIDVER